MARPLVPCVCRCLGNPLERLGLLLKVLHLELDSLAYGRQVLHSATDMLDDREQQFVGEIEGIPCFRGVSGCRAGHAASFTSLRFQRARDGTQIGTYADGMGADIDRLLAEREEQLQSELAELTS
ncbi:MAG: hypothetical protein ACRDYY_03845, partial [Acidimicrobiales bacterium]